MASWLRGISAFACVVALVVTDAAAVPKPADAAEDKDPVATAADLPLLASDPPPKVEPQVPPGNFSGMPGPLGLSPIAAAPAKPSFDPATSVALDDQTTPTKRVFLNDDGTHTSQLSTRPVRHSDPTTGRWVDDDLTLVAGTDGTLRPAAAPETAAVLSDQADGNVATVSTQAGPVSLRHPQAAKVDAVLKASAATFPAALPGGAELSIAVTADGFKETVVLPDRSAGPSYVEELVLPPAVSARDAADGIELVDSSGTVVATYGGGVAYDATYPTAGPAAATPVAVRVVDTRSEGSATVAQVEVAISSSAWWDDSARQMPITIDPSFATNTAAVNGGSDTVVISGANANTSYWNYPHLLAGTPDGTTVERSYLRFDLSSIPSSPSTWVSESHLDVHEWYAKDCTPRWLSVYRLSGGFNSATTWNNKPASQPTSPPTDAEFAKGATGCPAGWATISTTTLAQDWIRNGVTNNGLELRATNEADLWAFKSFYSADNGANYPTLYVTWNRQPPPAYPASPANGEVVTTTTPRLTATPVVDPDGNPVRYFFRATTASDAETGYRAVDSGWQTTSYYDVPAGVLKDGETYWWHVYSVRHEAP